jgi:hypothetical protein
LSDKLLLPWFDILPIGFKSNIVDRIMIEHKLRWSGLGCCMNSGSHGESNCREDPIPGSVC